MLAVWTTILEWLLGLRHGFLSHEGSYALQFHPQWPWQQTVGAATWNLFLGLAIVLVVLYAYRRDGQSRGARRVLGAIRLALLFGLLAMLNRPMLVLTQTQVEPSVLAIMVDDTLSMGVKDLASGPDGAIRPVEMDATTQPIGASAPMARLDAIKSLLTGDDAELIRRLSQQHVIHFYRFSSLASPMLTLEQADPQKPSPGPDYSGAVAAIDQLSAQASQTQVLASVQSVLEDLRGQRVAGVVVLTDGRSTQPQDLRSAIDAIREFSVPIYPVAVGSVQPPRDVLVDKIDVQDSAFQRDLVDVKATVRTKGYNGAHTVHVVLNDKRTGQPLLGPTSQPVEADVALDGNTPALVELPFKADTLGQVNVQVVAEKHPGELVDTLNRQSATVSVMDATVNVLYVDGYPRWDYRYVKNEMIRQRTLRLSCLLTSSDINFVQEASDDPAHPGSWIISEFPRTMEQLLRYDVVIFGDVDPHQFSDSQLQMVSDFVSEKHGGFGMVAGPRWAPQAYRNTPIEALLPVDIKKVEQTDTDDAITQTFRPVLTPEGQSSSIFRFLADPLANARYLKEDWQPLFWYCRGVTAKPGVAQVLAEHPTDTGPDGHKCPLLVVGYFGGGRTLFSAIDDSWRWRFYTGESVFDTYWVQQIRYLAHSKKLGQRRLTFAADHQQYEVGDPIRLTAEVIDPQLLTQLPDQLSVQLIDASGRVMRTLPLVKQPGTGLYVGTLTASMDLLGGLTAKLANVASGVDEQLAAINVIVPGRELEEPEVDRQTLSQLGPIVNLATARQTLPTLIKSAAKKIPRLSSQNLWDAPLAMVLFVLLISVEWIARKIYGMV